MPPIIDADDDNDADDGVCFGAEFSPTIEGCSSWYDWDYHNSDHRDQIVDQNNEHRDNSSCDDHPDHHDSERIVIILVTIAILIFQLFRYQQYSDCHIAKKHLKTTK